jgi:hypothetical protein
MDNMITVDSGIGSSGYIDKLAEQFGKYKSGEISKEEYDHVSREILDKEKNRITSEREKILLEVKETTDNYGN